MRAWENPTLNEIIGAGAAALVVIGAIAVVVLITVLGKWRYLWREWLTSLDHKKIGIMYVVLAFVMLVARAGRGGADARAAGHRDQRARHRRARSFRAAVQHARHHHDLLHGDAVPDRA